MKKNLISKNRIISALVIVAIILFISIYSITANNKEVSKGSFYFDTVINITLYGNDSKYIDKCFDKCAQYEKYFSSTKEGSDIYKINNNPGQYVTVSDDTIALIKKGIYYSKLSDGTFDITIGKLSSLWDIDNRTTPPTDEEIQALTKDINYKNIEIKGNQVRLTNTNCAIDLGAIAKGYIADQLVKYLQSKGVTRGLINLGGNVMTLGKVNNTPYKIGIQKPFYTSENSLCAVDVENTSVVTCGIYQRYFEYNGKLYHHILNISTGYPYDNDLNSVTILCKSSTKADALSTIAYTKGLKAGMKFIESMDGVEAIFITKENKIYKTSGVDKYNFREITE